MKMMIRRRLKGKGEKEEKKGGQMEIQDWNFADFRVPF